MEDKTENELTLSSIWDKFPDAQRIANRSRPLLKKRYDALVIQTKPIEERVRGVDNNLRRIILNPARMQSLKMRPDGTLTAVQRRELQKLIQDQAKKEKLKFASNQLWKQIEEKRKETTEILLELKDHNSILRMETHTIQTPLEVLKRDLEELNYYLEKYAEVLKELDNDGLGE